MNEFMLDAKVLLVKVSYSLVIPLVFLVFVLVGCKDVPRPPHASIPNVLLEGRQIHHLGADERCYAMKDALVVDEKGLAYLKKDAAIQAKPPTFSTGVAQHIPYLSVQRSGGDLYVVVYNAISFKTSCIAAREQSEMLKVNYLCIQLAAEKSDDEPVSLCRK